MGILNNIRNLFGKSNDTQSQQQVQEDAYAKSDLANKIVNLVDKIKRINSFDSSIMYLQNVTARDLENRKSIEELQKMAGTLENKLYSITENAKYNVSKGENIEASKWTGINPQGLSTKDVDRIQRDER